MNYKLVRTRRRTLCVQVVDSEVIVRSPLYLPQTIIDKFINDKQHWIESTLKKIESKKSHLSANEIFYKGEKHKIIFSDKDEISNSTIKLKISGNSKLERTKILRRFLTNQTKILVEKFLAKYPQFKYSSIKYSLYLSKWGSCSFQNELTFNIKLAMCPPEVIRYVVIHELCHIIHKNHSKEFWKELSRIMPNYKGSRKWLRNFREYL